MSDIPSELGIPIPASSHALSVSMPRWQDVVGYEEKEPEVIEALQTGYPRFVFHPAVQLAMETAARELGLEACLVFPSEQSVSLARDFVTDRHPESAIAIQPWRNVFVISMPTSCLASARLFWQHGGLGISSRHAEAILEDSIPIDDSTTKNAIRERIGKLAGVNPSYVWLFPTGMAAMHSAVRAVMELAPGKPTVQLSFPYLDTLKLQRSLRLEVHFYPGSTDADLTELGIRLSTTQIAGLFTEIPSNPLLQTIDSEKLAELARQYEFPVIVDDSLGCFYNQDTMGHADAVVVSLSKYFGGNGDVMGGALVVNPQGRYGRRLALRVQSKYEDVLFAEDAEVLELGSRDFPQRMDRVNDTAARLVERLQEHPAVERIYYGSTQFRENYDNLRRPGGGYGGVFSLLLKDAANTTPAFYDRLALAKGPSFGMRQTLVCPYTMLAHYHELDWAEEHGVSRYLIRFSIGLEEPDELLAVIEAAIE